MSMFILLAALMTGPQARAQAQDPAKMVRKVLLTIHFSDVPGRAAYLGFLLDSNGLPTSIYFADPLAKKEENRFKPFGLSTLASPRDMIGEGNHVAATIQYLGTALTLTYSQNALTTDPNIKLELRVFCSSDYRVCKVNSSAGRLVTVATVVPHKKMVLGTVGIEDITLE